MGLGGSASAGGRSAVAPVRAGRKRGPAEELKTAAKAAVSDHAVPPRLWIESMGGMAALAISAAAQLVSPGLSWRREVLRQYTFALRATIGPATVVAFVIGFSTIGIQGGSIASAFGAIDRISAIAPVVFLRELGPALTTAIVAGTLGATITAELGARKIRQELEALEVLGISPVRNLVLPRIVALAVAMPVLNFLTFWAGVFGALVAATVLYGATMAAFFDQLLVLTNYIDLWSSAVKVFVFGLVIGVIASYKGLEVSGGAEGVGRAVNESVVACLVVIFMISIVYTALFLAFFPELSLGG